jgi:hypothetical protein
MRTDNLSRQAKIDLIKHLMEKLDILPEDLSDDEDSTLSAPDEKSVPDVFLWEVSLKNVLDCFDSKGSSEK